MLTVLRALLIVWLVAGMGSYYYATVKHIPGAIVAAVLPALLCEASFYFLLIHERTREWLRRHVPRIALTLLLLASALLPYLLLSGIHVRIESLLLLSGLTAVLLGWYQVLKPRPLTDIGLLLFLAVVALARIWTDLYPAPLPGVSLAVLGQLMWIRLGIAALLVFRGLPGVRLDWWPQRRDWLVGLRNYALFLPVAVVLGVTIGFTRFHLAASDPLRLFLLAVGTFAGVFWVVALGEEVLFRGALQQWVSGWLKSRLLGLLISSVCFGFVHLWFRHQFPNWRFALLAAVASLFYGQAYQTTGSVRAAMVTHACVVTTWTLFFR